MPWWQSLLLFWRRLFGIGDRSTATTNLRVSGDPPSPNGASSMHLWWSLRHEERLTAVRATLEIMEAPVVERLYFWALQVTFVNPDGGGAHLGLQHNRRFPGNVAANFGGYAPQAVGGELDGIAPELPSTPNDPNTRDFAWKPHRPYRLSVDRVDAPVPEGFFAWRGAVEDLETARFTVVRLLFSRGEFLRSPVVWTEAFARCEHPSVAAKWSDLETVSEPAGSTVVTAGRVNYQRRDAGGCDNTNMDVEGAGWVQRTAVDRTVPTGTVLTIE